MMFEGFADIRALNDLENGIHSFDREMKDANREIENTIDLYLQDFERCLRILEERLQKAKDDLERAEIALERQRNRRVWVEDEDEDGGGHWEQADCSAEEAIVTRCQSICDRCRRDVDECRQMISDARTRRHVHEDKYSQFENKVSEAIVRMKPIKEKVEKHRSIQVPSSFSSSGRTNSFPSSSVSASNPSVIRDKDLSRPRPPMSSGITYGPKATPVMERPRSPQKEQVNPTPSRAFTEADRPRSPYGDGGRVTRDSVSSIWEGLKKIKEKHKNDKDYE